MSATSLAYVPSFTAQTDTNDLIAAHLAGDERASPASSPATSPGSSTSSPG